ncbi:hypothetical protein FRC06_004526 [Ceratobasidium sp. 370]|nr:hypothetical protein FRC06_004526 [Ceratobasidium sp. 370]
MSNQVSGSHPKHILHKTQAITDHDQEILKKKTNKEKHEREKMIREQEAALVAQEMAAPSHSSGSSTKSDQSKKSNKLKKSNKSTKSNKSKSTPQTTSQPDPQPDSAPVGLLNNTVEEERNVAEVLTYEAHCDKLIKLLHLHRGRPVSELITLDLKELENLFQLSKALQTPAKATSSVLVRASNIKPLGSRS